MMRPDHLTNYKAVDRLEESMNVNRVVLTGNLTADPELVADGRVCKLRLAVNGREKRQGEWQDYASYFDVTVFGAQGQNCKQYLAKGRPIAVDGRLRQRRWTTPEGQNRAAVEVIADSVQFLGARKDDAQNGYGAAAPQPDAPIDTGEFEPAPVSPGPVTADDIPF
jgi:single-strand DNA-binding protein